MRRIGEDRPASCCRVAFRIPFLLRLLLLALVLDATLSGARARGADPRPFAPTLSAGPSAPPPADTVVTPARPLPAELTICRDAPGRRCWSAPGRVPCRDSDHPAAEPYATVPRDESPQAGQVLLRCWQSVGRFRSPGPRPR